MTGGPAPRQEAPPQAAAPFTPLVDPAALGSALGRLASGLARKPAGAVGAGVRLGGNLAVAGAQVAARALGWDGRTALTPSPADRRFADPAWERNPWFLAQRQAYLSWARWLRDVAAAGDLDERQAGKAEAAVALVADALAPTNFLIGHPGALRRAVETAGGSLLDGLANFIEDLAENGGRPRQVDSSQFEVGRNLACTPGRVVFRNDLYELLQYAPQTDTVHEVPLLLSPPWINRYYIMDLAPGRSFVEWAVSHGHTTFALSYRNPDESMRHVRLDDYVSGLATALDVVRDVTGAPRANVAGLCVGGTLAVMLAAWLAAGEDGGGDRIGSLTLLNTLVDFSEPGPLAAFTDAEAVARVEKRMAETGYLEARDMASTFDALRPNDLVWNYVGANWLMGGTPPAFDILAWNADATRVAEATHSQYLRAFYLENRLARGDLELAGRPVRPGDVTADTYVLAAENDHITPWRSSYATTGLLGGDVRFVLSSAGHIAGIVNPPGPRRRHWSDGDDAPPLPDQPEAWRERAVEHPGSWWEDWAGWIGARSGRRRPPGPTGSERHPVLGEAPGTYVHR
jgi:polyhydroxyalkanoate synthase subunit PhaC